MRVIVLAGLALGIAIFAVLLAREGMSDVLAAVGAAGWGLAAVAAFHLVPLVADAHAWRLLVAPGHRPGLLGACYLRWVSESVNNLLPAAQVGGEFARARLAAHRGVPLATATAAATADVTLGAATLIPFSLVGVGGLAAAVAHADDGLLMALSGGLGLFALLIWLFAALQRAGPGRVVAGLVRRVTRGEAAAQAGGALDRELARIYADRRSVATAASWRLFGWIVGAGEIWIALWALDAPVGLWEALVLESVLQLVRSVAFVVPAALGIQEGALMGLAVAFGLDAGTGLALSLVRRVRDLGLGLPGLFAWQLSEGLARHGKPRRDG